MGRDAKTVGKLGKMRRRTAARARQRPVPKARNTSSSLEGDPESEVARLTKELREALQHQTATVEVLQAIGSSMADTQPVFERILDSTERLFDFRRAAIYLAPGDGLLHRAAGRGIGSDATDAMFPLPIEQTAVASVLGEGVQRYFPDALNGANVPESAARVARAIGNFSIVITPMVWEGRGIGTISVMREPNAAFSANELKLLRTFAEQAVIAIENARLFNETQKALERQTATLQDLRETQNSLIEAEKLAALGRLVAGVAHEVNNPVGTSLTVASSLERRTASFASEVARGDLKRSSLTEFIDTVRDGSAQLVESLNRAAGLIQSFKQVASDRNNSDLRPFDLGYLTEQIATGLRPALPKHHGISLNVECQPGLSMSSYSGSYGQVLTNLFLNSIAHAFPDGQQGAINIRVSALGANDVEIVFADNGCGMMPDVRRQAFDPFFTTRRHQGCTGLGLHIVHSVVTSRLGGHLRLNSEPGKGTEVRIILPRQAPDGK
jgi:signal transduction histidine kinase